MPAPRWVHVEVSAFWDSCFSVETSESVCPRGWSPAAVWTDCLTLDPPARAGTDSGRHSTTAGRLVCSDRAVSPALPPLRGPAALCWPLSSRDPGPWRALPSRCGPTSRLVTLPVLRPEWVSGGGVAGDSGESRGCVKVSAFRQHQDPEAVVSLLFQGGGFLCHHVTKVLPPPHGKRPTVTSSWTSPDLTAEPNPPGVGCTLLHASFLEGKRKDGLLTPGTRGVAGGRPLGPRRVLPCPGRSRKGSPTDAVPGD